MVNQHICRQSNANDGIDEVIARRIVKQVRVMYILCGNIRFELATAALKIQPVSF